ncbi:SGNH/GDSL hydrolase family protein [Bacillus manliponensis]|uniref:SGNH/GDSL hydrolase family protein n=1 Tax=Bacillus manliponensis TaxID=574376 RepID=UPI0035144132
MNKKVGLVLLMFVLFVASVVGGKLHWNKKVANATEQAISETVLNSKSGKGGKKAASFNEAYASNLPEAVQEKLKSAVSEKRALNLALVGDESSAEKGTWTESFTKNLHEAYGEGIWNVTVKSYVGEDTESFTTNERAKEIADAKPDVIVFQAPFVTDNKKIGNGNSIANAKTFVEAMAASAKDAVIMIQPSNPVYNARNYPKAIASLESFAQQDGYTYVNHWSAWPDPASEEILPYLQEEFGFPSEKGYAAWAQYMTDYFVAK